MTEAQAMFASVVFAANVVVAGVVGAATLFGGRAGPHIVFQGTAESSSPLQIVGAMWLAIAALSVVGVFRPQAMMPVLALQLLYKGGWLLAVALPAILRGQPDRIPQYMAAFFVVWVLVLPWVIDWGRVLGKSTA